VSSALSVVVRTNAFSADTQYRVFDVMLAKRDPVQARVLDTYTQMHTNQTVDFVREQVGIRYGDQNIARYSMRNGEASTTRR
jgi:hypothetical protein